MNKVYELELAHEDGSTIFNVRVIDEIYAYGVELFADGKQGDIYDLSDDEISQTVSEGDIIYEN